MSNKRLATWLVGVIAGALLAAFLATPAQAATTSARSSTVTPRECRETGDRTCTEKLGGDEYRITFSKTLYVTNFVRVSAPKAPTLIKSDCRTTGDRVCKTSMGAHKYEITFSTKLYLVDIKRVS